MGRTSCAEMMTDSAAAAIKTPVLTSADSHAGSSGGSSKLPMPVRNQPVAANRLNRHGLLFVWATVYGAIQGLLGYSFLFPYFLVVGLVAELSMIGRGSYRSPVRNGIGWMINCIGNFVGNAVPLWWSWETFRSMAHESGFTDTTLDMEYRMVMTPHLMLTGVVITAVLSVAGVVFGQRLLGRHFKKAGVVK